MPAAVSHLRDFIMPARPAKAGPARPGTFLSRMVQAVYDIRTRQVEREIARFIEDRGGRMTDDLERKIERHFV